MDVKRTRLFVIGSVLGPASALSIAMQPSHLTPAHRSLNTGRITATMQRAASRSVRAPARASAPPVAVMAHGSARFDSWEDYSYSTTLYAGRDGDEEESATTYTSYDFGLHR